MNIKRIIPIIFLAIALPSFAKVGDLSILSRRTEIFQNINCLYNDSCDLERIEYLVEDYRVELEDGFNYGTRFAAKYTTNTVELKTPSASWRTVFLVKPLHRLQAFSFVYWPRRNGGIVGVRTITLRNCDTS